MGRGIALGCKQRYPSIYRHYHERCKQGLVAGDSLLSYCVSEERRILLFPTKLDWKDPSPPELIIHNLGKLAANYAALKITSLALPPLGQANGWLRGDDKRRVQQATVDTLSALPIEVVLYVSD